MKIVVIGGTGLIGSRLVLRLREHGHEAVAASPETGVDTVTGEGLADALRGAGAVVDVSNSRSLEDDEALRFFETSTRTLLAAEAAAGVGHHVTLSVVGTDRLPGSGYLRAKRTQERLIEHSPLPHSPEAALERRETRGRHNRSDHPDVDESMRVNLVWSGPGRGDREAIPPVPDEISSLMREVSTAGKLVE